MIPTAKIATIEASGTERIGSLPTDYRAAVRDQLALIIAGVSGIPRRRGRAPRGRVD